jgi:hypothetical protein
LLLEHEDFTSRFDYQTAPRPLPEVPKATPMANYSSIYTDSNINFE